MRMKLKDIKIGENCFIVAVSATSSLCHRLSELGFVKGKEVKVIKQAPLGSPFEYEVMGSRVVLRPEEAETIEVTRGESRSTTTIKAKDITPKSPRPFIVKSRTEKNEKSIRVVLLGNPNCGKTSLFNRVTGLKSKVGNYGGVTVDKNVGVVKHKGWTIELIDLPGTYSLSGFTAEEQLVGRQLDSNSIDLVVNIVDASNLERNLLLTYQLLEKRLPVVVALNMIDELKKSGATLNIEQLEKRLSIPIVATQASRGIGVEELMERILQLVEKSDNTVSRDDDTLSTEPKEASLPKNPEDIFTLIQHTLSGIYHTGRNIHRTSTRIDRWLTHRWLGPVFLLLSLWSMFEATFTLGAYPQEWIESGIETLKLWTTDALTPGILVDLIVDGIIGGLGGVIVFLPNIIILFFFISLFEDTGYMARMAFITDRLMSKMGLNGKAFIPYLIGFGCGVPAIMATRTLRSPTDRIVAMLTIPFMSCAARLPVYLLFTAAFFSENQSLVLLSIYCIGALVAIITALLLRPTILRSPKSELLMELPPYRFPTLRNAGVEMWQKSSVYLRKMGSVILLASIVVWALGYFPQNTDPKAPKTKLENSYIGQMGKAVQPIVDPLGFDWKMSVGIITGLGAKEIVVSTMGVLYGAEVETDALTPSLTASLKQNTSITPLVAFAFMIFILLYFPCIAMLSAIRHEAGTRWALFSVGYTSLVAWIVAFGVIKTGTFLTTYL